MALGLALHHEEAEDVGADLGEQLVDGDVGRAALALLHLLAAARERHELVHHQLEPLDGQPSAPTAARTNGNCSM